MYIGTKLAKINYNIQKKALIKLADITPLSFSPIKYAGWRDIEYIQEWHISDTPYVQIITSKDVTASAVNVYLKNVVTDTLGNRINITLQSFNDSLNYANISFLSGITDGVYQLQITHANFSAISESFCVTSSTNILETSKLIEFYHKDNNSYFDNIWYATNASQPYKNQFRVVCGFKPDGITNVVETENFRNQLQTVVMLYSVPYTQYVLTIGSNIGVPYYVGTLINRIFSVTNVKIGEHGNFVRSEDSVPEGAQVAEDSQQFWFTITIEPQTSEISGVGGEQAAGTIAGSFAVSLNNLEDGDILVYDSDSAAFTNENEFSTQ